MHHSIVQKYIQGVIVWLRKLNIFKCEDHSNFGVGLERRVRFNMLTGTLKNDLTGTSANTDEEPVAKLYAKDYIDYNAEPKKKWITLRMHALEAVDKFPR